MPRLPSKKTTDPTAVSRARDLANTTENVEKNDHLSYNSLEMEDIESIEKLLNAAHELMRHEPALRGAALEDIRRLKVRVRFAKSAAVTPKPGDLPSVAPALFEDRANKDQSPLDFTVETWGPWLRKRLVCRADIRRLNLKLYEAYFNWGISSEQLDAIGLPTKRAVLAKKLKNAGPLKRPRPGVRLTEMGPEEHERALLWYSARRKKRRAAKAPERHA